MPIEAFFDATNITPEQSGPKHPVGKKFPAIITNTGIKETANKEGAYLFVTFTTPQGSIDKTYNRWNKNEKTVEIAIKQLAALLHSVGIYKIHCALPNGDADFQNAGSEIRNSRCQIDVDYQRGEEPSPEKPQGGYIEVSRVYDANGNEPGKTPAAPQPGQPQGGWSAPQPPAPQTQPGWSSPQQSTPNTAPQSNPAPANNVPAWTQGPSAAPGQAPPWAAGR